jgi:hypothetical protein
MNEDQESVDEMAKAMESFAAAPPVRNALTDRQVREYLA